MVMAFIVTELSFPCSSAFSKSEEDVNFLLWLAGNILAAELVALQQGKSYLDLDLSSQGVITGIRALHHRVLQSAQPSGTSRSRADDRRVQYRSNLHWLWRVLWPRGRGSGRDRWQWWQKSKRELGINSRSEWVSSDLCQMFKNKNNEQPDSDGNLNDWYKIPYTEPEKHQHKFCSLWFQLKLLPWCSS